MNRIEEITSLLNNPNLSIEARQKLESERYRLVAHHSIPTHDREKAAADYMTTRDSFNLRRIENAISITKADIEAYEALNSPSGSVAGRIKSLKYTLNELEEQKTQLMDHYKRLPLEPERPVVDVPSSLAKTTTASKPPQYDLAFETIVEAVYLGESATIDPLGLLKGHGLSDSPLRGDEQMQQYTDFEGASEHFFGEAAQNRVVEKTTTKAGMQEISPESTAAPDGGSDSTTEEISEDSSASTSGDKAVAD